MSIAQKHSGNEAAVDVGDVNDIREGEDPVAPAAQKLRCGDIEIDCIESRVTVAGVAVELTDSELTLLHYFIVRSNRLLTRSELLDKVWNSPFHAGSNLVDVVVCRLRRKLGTQGRMIETVHGLGYRFRAVHRPTSTRAEMV
jgi:DNA-binding response OmpR family regulator